jgi:hypothetical protein
VFALFEFGLWPDLEIWRDESLVPSWPMNQRWVVSWLLGWRITLFGNSTLSLLPCLTTVFELFALCKLVQPGFWKHVAIDSDRTERERFPTRCRTCGQGDPQDCLRLWSGMSFSNGGEYDDCVVRIQRKGSPVDDRTVLEVSL